MSISCCDFVILLVCLLQIFGSAGEKAQQKHIIFLAILHQGVESAIFVKVKFEYESFPDGFSFYWGSASKDEEM